ncbi:hypothetical protein DFJ58DRAFT_762013 [Suillus subalutaceus]|uniref:uncharacterized protein n=1 Tax=Suillus subalutaceus TaxID=48586 RepID=UPI001B882FB1|nr:uncharacterized protein DFJ58DRAFT_762013 [Suillus subalutaceus]KAG1872504.1 hypothetical protein DFJ58DRAFT_762013 [Suillus subalutaceus]
MAPVTKIMYFKTTASYLQDPSRLIAELTTASSADIAPIEGLSKLIVDRLRAYIGFETEDPSNAFWVFGRSSLRHTSSNRQDTFKATQAISQQIFASTPTSVFVNFSDTSRIFSAPVTEFVTFTLKEGVSMDALQPLVAQLEEKLQGTPKFYGSSWASVNDKPNVVYGVLGWESVQAHWDAVTSGPLKDIIDEVKKIADLWLVHAILTQSNA